MMAFLLQSSMMNRSMSSLIKSYLSKIPRIKHRNRQIVKLVSLEDFEAYYKKLGLDLSKKQHNLPQTLILDLTENS
jgi:hypothetical protein